LAISRASVGEDLRTYIKVKGCQRLNNKVFNESNVIFPYHHLSAGFWDIKDF